MRIKRVSVVTQDRVLHSDLGKSQRDEEGGGGVLKKANQSDFQLEERRCFRAGSSFLFLPKSQLQLCLLLPPFSSLSLFKSFVLMK